MADLLVGFEVIDGLLPGFYQESPLPMTRQLGDIGVDRAAEAFVGKRGAGTVLISVILEKSSAAASDNALKLYIGYVKDGEPRELPLTVTKFAYLAHTFDPDALVLVAAQGKAIVIVNLTLGNGATAENADAFVSYVAIAQLDKLTAAGY